MSGVLMEELESDPGLDNSLVYCWPVFAAEPITCEPC